LELPDGYSATEPGPNGRPRYCWESIRPTDTDAPTYRRALTKLITQCLAWREQYERARDGTGPPDIASHSATGD
jgi:hypothetical protein